MSKINASITKKDHKIKLKKVDFNFTTSEELNNHIIDTGKIYGLKKSEYMRLLVLHDYILRNHKKINIFLNYGITLEENELDFFIKEMKKLSNEFDVNKRFQIYSLRHKRHLKP